MRELSLAISEAARANTLEEIGQNALPALARALDACPSFLAEASANFVDSEAIAGEHKDVLSHYLHEFVVDDPLIAIALTRRAPVLILEDHVERRSLLAGRAYNEFHRNFDFENHMLVRFHGDGLTTPGALAMGFTRGKRLPAFGPRDMRIAELVLPALQGAAGRILATERRRLERDASRVAMEQGLTRAETRVLSVLLSGSPNREIARRLCVSVDTVKTHVQRILRKLGVTSRAQAIAVVGTTGDGHRDTPPSTR
jgi:DNA-binding CsgD family transcriptional regulator